MKSVNHILAWFIALLILPAIVDTALSAPPSAKGPLRPHPANPRYFTDGGGKAVYLTGAHTWANLQDQAAKDPPPAFDFDRYLDFLERHHHNFIRLWAWEQARWAPWSDGKGPNPKDWYIEPNPYARTGPGTARDGKPKFDLSKFDPAYFNRLRQRVDKAGQRGIYVSVMLFQGWSSAKSWHGGRPWLGHPYHPENNLQKFNGNLRSDVGPDLADPRVREHQAAYLRKVIDTINDLDNVLYEVTNEGGTKDWDWWVVRTVQDYERTKPKQHPVGLTGHGSENNDEMLASPAAWFSPGSDGWKDLRTDPRPAPATKPSLLDTDHVFGVGGDQKWVWKGFLRGHNVLFMDPYDDPQWTPILEGQGVGTRHAQAARQAMGHARRCAERMDLAATTPNPELSSTGFCLANPGREYLVYLPNGGEAQVDLTKAPGKFSVEWMHAITGKTTPGGEVSGGGRRTLKAPFSGDAAVYLRQTAATATASGLSAARDPDLIRRENAKPGAEDWQLTYVRLDSPTGYRSPGIEGYCSRRSVAAGESIDFMVSADPPGKFTIEIFRMGYYGGRGARQMAVPGPFDGRPMTTLGPYDGKPQPLPPVGPRRLRECRWTPAARLTIPADWPSGVYLGRLSRVPDAEGRDPWQSYTVFIVRDDRPADILFQCSDNTWQAYNRWPDLFSLYDNGLTTDWTSLPDIDVSFDRPYGKYRQIYENPQSVGSGEFLCWEFPMVYWLEQHGYDVTYCSQSDMIGPERGKKCKAFISIGHDEYWDRRSHDAVAAMRDAGVSLLFLSGNTLCWVTPMRAGSDGRPNRIITRAAPYRGLTMGSEPVRDKFPFVGPDEGLLLGARNIVPVNGGGDWIVTKPEHWMFAGTGMKNGDRVRGLVGWEFHGMPADIPGLEVVAEGKALNGGVRPVPWTATIYPAAKGGYVFNASTIFWAQGLSSPPGHMLPWSHTARPHGPDQRVQKITHNLLRRALDR